MAHAFAWMAIAASSRCSAEMIGRSRETALIAAAIERTLAGRAGAVIVLGEAGIGKTRLCEQGVALARDRGFVIAAARGHALRDALAYGPIVAVVRVLLDRMNDARRKRVLDELPDVAALIGASRKSATPTDPALARTMMFDGVARFLERVTQDAPLLLWIDDLHACDAPSLDVLQYCVGVLTGRRVLLLASSRTEDEASVAGLLRSLRRLGLLSEITLARLHRPEIAAMAGELLAADPPAELVDLLAKRTSGVPLFVDSLVRALLDSARLVVAGERVVLNHAAEIPVPPIARDVLRARIEGLPDDERRLVDLLAIGGEVLAHELLVEVSETEERAVLDALRRLSAKGLVVEETVERRAGYALGHPLFVEVAAAELPRVVRERLHLRFVHALERARVDSARLARHYAAAGDVTDRARALAVLSEAGFRSLSLFANEEAARWLAAAAALADESQHAGQVELLGALAEARHRMGRADAARSTLIEALSHKPDRPTTARLQRKLAQLEWDRGDIDAADELLRTAVDGIRASPSPELVELLCARARLCERRGDLAGCESAVAELRDLTRQLDDPRVIVEALLADGDLRVAQQRHDVAASLIDEALRAASAIPALELKARDAAQVPAFELADHDALRTHAQRALELAKKLGSPSAEVRAHGCSALADLFAGRYAEAIRQAEEVMRTSRRLGIPRGIVRALSVVGYAHIYRGDLAAAEGALAELRSHLPSLAGDVRIAQNVAHLDGVIALELEDHDRLRAALPKVVGTRGEIFARRLALHGRASVLLGDRTSALSDADSLDALGAAPAYRGFALHVRGLATGERAALQGAVDAFRRAALPFELAAATVDLAHALDGHDAIACARDALTIAERIGATRVADRARKYLRSLGDKPAPKRRAGVGGGPLSARELEVAKLFAEGLTTADVAKRLVISPHTAATHLSNIYERLGVRSRAGLTKLLAERGWLR
jgi:DNA-binding CsgD family transcriptional regulator